MPEIRSISQPNCACNHVRNPNMQVVFFFFFDRVVGGLVIWLWGHVTVVSFVYNVGLAHYFCRLYFSFKIKFVLICEDYHDEQNV